MGEISLMLSRKQTNPVSDVLDLGTQVVDAVVGIWDCSNNAARVSGCVSQGTTSHYYLCWFRQARGAPCTPLCCRTARTFSSHQHPSAAFPACPQTASCLLRGRRLPRWEGESRVMCGNVSEIKGGGCLGGKGGVYGWGDASESAWGGVGDEGETPCHCTCMNNKTTTVWLAVTKREGLLACCTPERRQSAATRAAQQTNSIWWWLKCLSPSVWSEKLLRLSPSAKDRIFCTFEPIHYKSRNTFLQIILRKKTKGWFSTFLFYLFFSSPNHPGCHFRPIYFSVIIKCQRLDVWDTISHSWTCHYPYCEPTCSPNVKEIADDNVVWLETPACAVRWRGGFWVLGEEKHWIHSLCWSQSVFKKKKRTE